MTGLVHGVHAVTSLLERRPRAIREALLQAGRNESLERAAAAPLECRKQRDDGEHRPQRVDPGRLGEVEPVHGSLRRKLPDATPATPISTSAATTKAA